MSLATLVLPPSLIQVAPSKGRPDFSRTDLLSELAIDPATKQAKPTRVADEETVKKEIAKQLPKPTMAPKPQAAPAQPATTAAQASDKGRGSLADFATGSDSGVGRAVAKTGAALGKVAKTGAAVLGGAVRGAVGAQDKDFGQPKPNPAGADQPEADAKAEDPAAAKPKKAKGDSLEEKPAMPKQAVRHDPSTHATVDGPGGQKFTIHHGTHPNKLEAHPQHDGVFIDPTTGKHYAPAGHPIHQTGVHGMAPGGMAPGPMQPAGGGYFPPGGGGGGMSWFNPGGTTASQAPAPMQQPAQVATPMPAAAPAAQGPGVLKRAAQGAFRALDNLQAGQAAQQAPAQPQTPAAAQAAGAQGAPAQDAKPAKPPAPDSVEYHAAMADTNHPYHAAVNAHAASKAKPPEQAAPDQTPPAAPAAAPAATKTPAAAVASAAKSKAEKPATKPKMPDTPPPSAGTDLAQRIGLPQGVETKKPDATAAKPAAPTSKKPPAESGAALASRIGVPAGAEAPAKVKPESTKADAKPEASTTKMPAKPPTTSGDSLADRIGVPKGAETPEKKSAETKPADQSTEKGPEVDDKTPVRALLGIASTPAAEKKARRSALGDALQKHGVDSPEVAAARDKFVAASAKEKESRPDPDMKPASTQTAKAPAGAKNVANVAAKSADSSADRVEGKSRHKEAFAKLAQSHPELHKAFSDLEAAAKAGGVKRDEFNNVHKRANKAGEKAAERARSENPGVSEKQLEKIHLDAMAAYVQQKHAGLVEKHKDKLSKSESPQGAEPVKAATTATAQQVGASLKKNIKKAKDEPEAQTASYNPPLDKMIQEWIR